MEFPFLAASRRNRLKLIRDFNRFFDRPTLMDAYLRDAYHCAALMRIRACWNVFVVNTGNSDVDKHDYVDEMHVSCLEDHFKLDMTTTPHKSRSDVIWFQMKVTPVTDKGQQMLDAMTNYVLEVELTS